MESQSIFRNTWSAGNREASAGEISRRQASIVPDWLSSLQRNDLDIIEVGCSKVWLCPHIVHFGRATV